MAFQEGLKIQQSKNILKNIGTGTYIDKGIRGKGNKIIHGTDVCSQPLLRIRIRIVFSNPLIGSGSVSFSNDHN
jgi:hypothetical protein